MSKNIKLDQVEDEVFNMLTVGNTRAAPEPTTDGQPPSTDPNDDSVIHQQNGVFGNKGTITSAVGIQDVKTIIMEVILLTEESKPEITPTRKFFAYLTIAMSSFLLLLVFGAFLFLKRDEDEKNIKKRNQTFK